MINYELTSETHGIAYLTAPYALLVEAFGNDGINPRDMYKSMCQWESNPDSVDAGLGWEVYDYKEGVCYWPKGEGGLEREEITVWHVQADAKGRAELIELLDAAVIRRLVLQETVKDQLEAAESFEEACRKANGETVEQDEISQLIDELGDGGAVVIGETDEDGFFVGGGLEVSLDGVRVGVGMQEEGLGDASVGISLADIRKAHALLGAYLALVDEGKS
jgi:hypothetical protein